MSHRAHEPARKIADRHYNRQKPGSPQFVPPGRCLVLLSEDETALWVTSWPFAQYVKHAWGGAWLCSCFRNEGPHRASELIREAVAATLAYWPEPPDLGMVTFVDSKKVRSTNPGFCYLKAGFKRCGMTKGGLHALQMLPDAFPEALPPIGFQMALESESPAGTHTSGALREDAQEADLEGMSLMRRQGKDSKRQ